MPRKPKDMMEWALLFACFGFATLCVILSTIR